ncbi:hypothetical protein ACFV5N_00575 [Streptomyces sp. NPDC059853]|uniref:hypothetical protein n=1 Tax=Streptomyces sp. NPDC059853 TaxID=3346973 RepID=UPI00365FCB43
MSRYGRIERGYMAADRFVQISNDLVRDRRLTRKARGLFAEIASHRDGFGITVEALVRTGPEGRDAITSGLKELERYGYLARHQERDERGRLGTAVYRITDSPARPENPQNPRSGPLTENPATGEPATGEPEPKKTKIKKTSTQKTQPSPPSHQGTARKETAPEKRKETAPPEAAPASPGVSLLLGIGAREHRLGIGGQALSRLGTRLDALLATGWSPEDLRTALIGGLPPRVNSPAGFLARRIDAIPAAPSACPSHDPVPLPGNETYVPPRFGDHAGTPPLPECEDCGVPPVPGYGRCAACMDWPFCDGCQRRRTIPGGNGLCRTCNVDEQEWQAAADAFSTLLEDR